MSSNNNKIYRPPSHAVTEGPLFDRIKSSSSPALSDSSIHSIQDNPHCWASSTEESHPPTVYFKFEGPHQTVSSLPIFISF